MPGIDNKVIEHKLNVDPTRKPIQQKRQVFAPERNKAVVEEVEKLLTAGFIREVYYPKWLANVVMMKKSNKKWRMCVDFTDLNHACPKDIPQDRSTGRLNTGHELLTFMDSFSSYNQIRINKEDQEKKTFVTS